MGLLLLLLTLMVFVVAVDFKGFVAAAVEIHGDGVKGLGGGGWGVEGGARK